MDDPQFGKLKRDGDRLEGKVSFPQFATWGAALDVKDPPDRRPAAPPDRSPTRAQLAAVEQVADLAEQLGGEEASLLNSVLGIAQRPGTSSEPGAVAEEQDADADERLGRQGVCDVQIETTGPRAKPARAQRAAWEALIARGDALWDELLGRAFEIYGRQRPVRRRWWRAVYGDYLIDRRFPDVQTPEQFARLIRPALFRIKPPADKGAASAAVTLIVRATWDVDGFGVIFRDGRIAEFGQVIDVMNAPARPPETIDHPTFGRLKRIPDDDPMEYINEWEAPTRPGVSGFANVRRVAARPWLGRVQFDPLREFAMIADARAQYANDPERADHPASRMAWEFADGEFEVRVYSPAGQPPSDAQAAAWAAFHADHERHAADLIDAIFRRYQESWEARRRGWTDRYVDENVPAITGPAGLRDLIQLRHIHVHPDDGSGGVTIGFQFVTAYDYDGLAALWRGGRVEHWGRWKEAEFREPQ
ncbi:MAG TPA: hypothetical protein VEA69_23240 [Tepidisphaeraceae bacterium]|nr:hypothetical protein [Tepidisphaeraceae bacterium]